LIEEELRIQTQDQVQREKASKKTSQDRKRSWDPDFYKLGRGITEDTSRDELISFIKQLKQENEDLKTRLNKKKEIDEKNVQSFCAQNGYKSFKDFLQYTNAINAAEKGKLNSPK
tara:strand:- start:99 stop:443 length:345 start_codon:yes stop_codon:yes gene_type:complete